MTSTAPRTAGLHGRVLHADGTPAPGVTVSVSVRTLRSHEPLGETNTAADGGYRLECPVPDGPAELLVRVGWNGCSTQAVRALADVEEHLELRLAGAAPSLYARLSTAVDRHLDGLRLGEVGTDADRHDLGYLSRATGHAGRDIGRLAQAARLAQSTGLSAESFFGLLSRELPADPSALAQRSTEEVRASLAAAAENGVIDSAEGAEEFTAALRALELEAAAARAPLNGSAPSALAQIFAAAVSDPDVRARLYSTHLDRTPAPAALAAAADGHAERLELALELGRLTGDNPALVRTLLARFDTGEFTHRRDLVRLDADWAEVVAEAGGVPGPTAASAVPDAADRDSVRAYAESIRARVAEAYPTPHLAFRLAGHPEHAQAPGTRFLVENPEFDLLAAPVNAETVPDEEARPELAAIQRTFKVAPRFEAMQALRDNGFHSSYAIAGIGPGDFARQLAGSLDEAEARSVHARATQVHAEAVNLVADLRTAGQIEVPWLAPVLPQTAQIPDWEELFGPQDYAPVDESRSVYSQSAYLVDLLYYLRRLGGGAQTGPSKNGPVADVLYARRPDLWDVDLSKENTELSIPYIDLVNELLESAVSPETAVSATTRQCSGSSQELRVQPQHVNTGAYDRLRAAVYPWHLPFDLRGEQTANHLEHLGVTREDLLLDLCVDTTRPGDLHTLLTAARLGLSSASRKIIAGEALTPPHTLAEFYGQPAGTADAALATTMTRVRTLLDTAGLRFTELAAVLETRFVNPGGVLRVLPDPLLPAATDKMTLEGLDGAALDRLHRFVRLQRALDVTAQELDRLIQGVNNEGRLDTLTLRSIASVRSVARRLDLPVELVLAFCRTVDTHRYASDAEPPLYDRLFLDPAVVPPQPGTPHPFALNADRIELAAVGSLETPAVSAALLAALQVTDAELAELVGGPDSPLRNKVLNLVNLSVLVCAVTLARTLGMTLPDLLRLARTSGSNPWSHLATSAALAAAQSELAGGAVMGLRPAPLYQAAESELAGGSPVRPPGPEPTAAGLPLLPAATVMAVLERFLGLVEPLAAAGFDLAEVEAVLDARYPDRNSPVPDDPGLRATLTALRSALQAVYAQTAVTGDEKGEVTRKNLALLGWEGTLVQDAVATLAGTTEYTAVLAALPGGVTLPPDLPVRFVPGERPQDRRLLFTGPMRVGERERLLALAPADAAAFRSAVQELHDAPRLFVSRRMGLLRIPVFSAPLDALPVGYAIPSSLAGKVFHDITGRALRSRGYLGEAELDALEHAPGADSALLAALTALRTAQEAGPEEGNEFLTAADAGPLFDGPDVTPADRFRLVLERLTPPLRRALSEATVVQQLGQAAGLEPALAGALLGTWLRGASGKPVFEEFLAPAFTGSDPAVVLTRVGFAAQFTALQLVHRAALVLTKLRFTAEELPFLFRYAGPDRWLDLGTLPAAPPAQQSQVPFLRLCALVDVARLRDSVPGGIATLEAAFALATTPGTTDSAVIRELSRRTGWPFLDVNMAARNYQINTRERFTEPANLDKLRRAVAMYRRLGVSAERANLWLRAEFTPEAAQAAWGAARALHSAADWPSVAGPMQDALRDRQRAALVAYLVAHPLLDGQTPLWQDANGLHDHFLLDVEMSTAQLTTRITQAAYGIQLFVQRCLLNLEPQVSTSDSELWEQWEWMKRYRLWEANQKIFLYPENYFEPDLRADKSPFFAQLETDLTQKELTDETAKGALLGYLEELAHVARLQPSGVYIDHVPDSSPTDFSRETIHVLARSESAPRSHYYRSWVNRLYWTPWQKVSLDIDGESLTLGLWNKQLYAFWPTFLPAGEPKDIQALPDGTEGRKLSQSPKFWQIQLNWSEYRNGQWTPKRVSTDMIATNPPLPDGWSPETRLLPFLDPAVKEPYMFISGSDQYSQEPIVWCHNAHRFEIKHTSGDIAWTGTWGRFRLSRRRGSMLAEPVGYSALRIRQRLPSDPEGKTAAQSDEHYRLYFAPFGQVVMNNAWVENQSGDASETRFLWLAGQRILDKTPVSLPFRVISPLQDPLQYYRRIWFFTDSERSYLVWPSWHGLEASFKFLPFYHPHVELFSSQLSRLGVDGLFNREVQMRPGQFAPLESFAQRYSPNSGYVVSPYPTEDVEFDATAPYAVYNWELFFHAPLLMAGRLSTNQRFGEAQKWFHRIFDPTDRSSEPGPQRYWRTKPFYLMSTDPNASDNYQKQRIEEILRRLATGNTTEAAKMDAWLRHPFQPDVVARLRTTAYQKAVVMKYLDNLIAWGDQLFRQDTLESVNEATQLYLLAAELLGRRPEEVPRQGPVQVLSFRELTEQSPAAADPLTATENLLPPPRSAPEAISPGVGTRWLDYFGIPRNEKLMGYWDAVEDRLFKIRHGQNIEGVARPTPLFGATIDPALLARATSAGLDLGTVLADMNAPVPHYRFGPMLAKAKELAQQVQSLGGALLASLEKRDAEALARLRSTHEYAALEMALSIKGKQFDEASRALTALQDAQAVVKDKEDYYTEKCKKRMNEKEEEAAKLVEKAKGQQKTSAAISGIVSALSMIPNFKIGSPTSVGATFGGHNIADSMAGAAQGAISYFGVESGQAQQSSTVGGYDHRFEEWTFLKGQATKEFKQYQSQIAGAEIRKAAAQIEVFNQEKLMANAREADTFLRGKYTNRELYEWTAAQLSTTYFQVYQLAYDVAKRTERAFRHELGTEKSDFIRFGYWDSLHKGLLSGERLSADLHRMEAAYLEANARELELTKRVSLAQLDPGALRSLKETGKAYFSLPEALFDLDTPGHWMRRMKQVSFTVPCVAGPYTAVNLTATLLKSSIRVEPRLNGGKHARLPGDIRFRDHIGPVQSVVTSTGQEDSGLFESSLHDERFLPFEGAGAVGEWQLSLPDEFRQFDYETISDVVMQLRYTARDGGGPLAGAAVDELHQALNGWLHAGGGKGLYRHFSARREFPDRWNRFLATAPGSPAVLAFSLSKRRFPYLFRDDTIKLNRPELVLILSTDLVPDGSKRYLDCYPQRGPLTVALAGPGGTHGEPALVADPSLGGQPRAVVDGVHGQVAETEEDWVVTVPADKIAGLAPELLREGRLNPDGIVDLLLVWQHSVERAGGR
ncbi:neuraminidase-like domain-containing protein [Streptomyces sp. NPDC056491]|uniref:Tc toxin subunit A-related protein n=1 Tax=Streptomyces sp. NPDC056491 TaxID=3345837 RepID=UPI00368473D4